MGRWYELCTKRELILTFATILNKSQTKLFKCLKGTSTFLSIFVGKELFLNMS